MKRRMFLGAAVLTLLVAGCQQDQQMPFVDPEPPGHRGHVFQDTPVPVGFTVDDHDTVSRTNASFRYAKIVATGNRRVAELIAWYKQVMVNPHGWTFASESGSLPNPVALIFEKGSERCTVDIRSESRDGVRITIDVSLK